MWRLEPQAVQYSMMYCPFSTDYHGTCARPARSSLAIPWAEVLEPQQQHIFPLPGLRRTPPPPSPPHTHQTPCPLLPPASLEAVSCVAEEAGGWALIWPGLWHKQVNG